MSKPHIDAATIGRRLSDVFFVLDKKPAQVARETKILETALSQYLGGKRAITVRAALVLCEQYDLTLDYIYRGDMSGIRSKVADALRALRGARDNPN